MQDLHMIRNGVTQSKHSHDCPRLPLIFHNFCHLPLSYSNSFVYGILCTSSVAVLNKAF